MKTDYKYFKKCSCGAVYSYWDLPAFLHMDEDCAGFGEIEYINCTYCHSTMVILIAKLKELKVL
jgi:hypothetical protein